MNVNAIVLYVRNIEDSLSFYERTFKTKGIKISDSFANIELGNCSISLKAIDKLIPSSNVLGGGTEISFFMDTTEEFDFLYNELHEDNVIFIQKAQEVFWGCSFVFEDPDQHRIRINVK